MSDAPAVNLFDPALLENPHPMLDMLRATAPVFKLPISLMPGGDMFIVTKYEAVNEVLKNWQIFSNDFGDLLMGNTADLSNPEIAEVMAKAYENVPTLLTNDPPSHKSYRTLVNQAFSSLRVNSMEDYIRALVDELIDGFIDKGECDFFADFAVPLPVMVIADQLGVPRADLSKFKEWSDAALLRIGRMGSQENNLEAVKQLVEMQQYLAAIIETRRTNPQDDIISDLSTLLYEDERPLTTEEILSILFQLLVAGNETTTSSLAGGMVHFLQHPDQMAQIIANPDMMDNAVEEILRFETPIMMMFRVVKQDTVLEGVEIKAGSAVLISFDAADRDPAKFEDPNSFNIARENARSHFAFSRGIHACVGAQLARKELTISYAHLFKRLKDIRLAPDKNTLKHEPNMLHRSLAECHLVFSKA